MSNRTFLLYIDRLSNLPLDSPRLSPHRCNDCQHSAFNINHHFPPIIVILIIVIVIIITVIRSSSPHASSLLLHATCKSNHQTSAVQIERLSFSSKSSKPRDALSPHQLVQSADGAEGKQDNQAECKQIQPNLPRSEVICVSFRALLV